MALKVIQYPILEGGGHKKVKVALKVFLFFFRRFPAPLFHYSFINGHITYNKLLIEHLILTKTVMLKYVDSATRLRQSFVDNNKEVNCLPLLSLILIINFITYNKVPFICIMAPVVYS